MANFSAMSFLRRSALVVVTSLFALVPARALRAQSTTPVVSQPLPAQTIAAGAGVSTIDLRNYFALPNVVGQIAQIDTVRGKFNVELLAADAPKTVANFLNYVNKGAYTRTFFHRSVPGFVIQAGGFALLEGGSNYTSVAADAPVVNEFKVPNTRGTLAMAKLGSGPNIAALPIFNASQALSDGAFDNLPLISSALSADSLILVRSIKVIPVYPAAPGDTAVLAFSVASSEPAIVGATISGSLLVLSPGSGGRATLTVRATDVNGNAAESVLVVTNGAAPPRPTFITQPVAQTVAVGSTVVFNSVALGAPTFEWRRNGALVAGATSATLVISGASAAQEGTYTVTATNASGAAISDSVSLKTNTATATQVGRLVNLSILTTAGTGSKILTVGASVGPLSSTEALPLVMRGVGPALKEFFGISGALDDPTMTIFPLGSSSALAANDNWGSGQATNSLFKSLGAFELSPGSLDSAFASLAPGLRVGGYTVQVAGKGSSSGTVIAEIYDAAGSARTATTPRLVNLSTRAQLDTAGELIVGFVLRGLSARTVLVRAVGPSLGALGVEGVMPDPKLELFDNDNGGKKIGENDNWGGDEQVVNVARSVGAFALAGNDTKDAVLLMTLPAGAYSARLSGVGGAGGTAIVEVYEVP